MKQLMVVLFGLLFSGSIFAASSANKIDGLWEAKYDASNTPSAHIRLTTQANGEVVGVIEQAYPRPGEKGSATCTKCTGADKDKPVIGLKILWGMMPSGKNQWSKGQLLDAETGKVYSGKLKLADNGNELDMRGYVLSPMFGETATWKRIK